MDDLVALLRALTAGVASAAPRERRAVAVTGSDEADLVLRFAREVLAMFQLEAIVAGRFELRQLSLPPDGAPALSGLVLGERFDPARHETQPEVKAVTRHGLVVRQHERGWHAELVIDV